MKSLWLFLILSIRASSSLKIWAMNSLQFSTWLFNRSVNSRKETELQRGWVPFPQFLQPKSEHLSETLHFGLRQSLEIFFFEDGQMRLGFSILRLRSWASVSGSILQTLSFMWLYSYLLLLYLASELPIYCRWTIKWIKNSQVKSWVSQWNIDKA